MPDQYDALVSGVPTDAQSQQALAAGLRRQALLGQLGQASGDRVLAPLGHGLTSESDTQAHQIGQLREQEANSRQALQFHNDQQANELANRAWQQKYQAGELAEKTRNDTMQDARQRDLAKIADQIKQQNADTAAARESDAKGKVAAGKPLPVSASKDIEQTLDAQRGVDAALEQAQALHSQGQQIGGVGRNIKNWISANSPLGTNAMDASQNFWAQYGRSFTLPELKATIGTRHNEYMQNLFEGYHINPNMSNDQIINNLSQISKQIHQRTSSRAADYQSQGYDVGKYADAILDPKGGRAGGKYLDAVDQQATPQPQAQPQPQPQPQGSSVLQQALQRAQQQQQLGQPNTGSMLSGLVGSQ